MDRTNPKTDTPVTRERSRRVRTEYVYFIHGGDRIKIGFSHNPMTRLKELQTSTADDLQLLGAIPGDEQQEKALHAQFKGLHIRGEWFRADPELITYICQVTGQPLPEIDPPEAPEVSPEARAMISSVLTRRNRVGADTPRGAILSNLANQARHLNGSDPKPWATHPMQTVKGLMEWNAKRLAALTE